jgi:hypothetical protein
MCRENLLVGGVHRGQSIFVGHRERALGQRFSHMTRFPTPGWPTFATSRGWKGIS